MAPSDIAARDAIRELVARYAVGVDRGRFAEVAELFVADGVLELPDGRRAHGREAIAAVFAEAGTSLESATHAPLVRHHVTSHAITIEGAAVASGIAYFLVLTGHGLDHWGVYRDRYAVLDGRWRFASRHVRVDGATPESWAGRRGHGAPRQ